MYPRRLFAFLLMLSGCLPAYDNHFKGGLTEMGEGGTGGDMGTDGSTCAASTQVVNGKIYSWGPQDNTAGFKAGVVGNVQGFDCLMGMPSTTTAFSVPIPQAVLNDGKPHWLDFRGMTENVPLLHTISGPLILDGSDLLDHGLVRHVILDQPGNIRDVVNKELSITLGTTHSFVYGTMLNKDNTFMNSVVTVTAPADATSNCTVYYQYEFMKGATTPFINKTAQNAFAGFFLITCKASVTGPITLHATTGMALDGTVGNFADISVPLSLPDAVVTEWSPM